MNTVYLKLISVMFFWGTAFVSGRVLSHEFHPFVVAFIRFFLASLCLFPILYYKNQGRLRPPKDQWFNLLFLGLTGVFLYNAFFFSGLKLVEAGRSSIIISINPVITSLFSVIVLRERISITKILGIILGLFGLIIVLTHGHPVHIFKGEFGLGEIFLLLAVCSWVTYTLLGKKVMVALEPLEASTWAACLGGLLLFPVAIYFGLFENISKIGAIEFMHFINLGIFSTCFGFIWYYQGVKAIGALNTSSFINLIPIFGILFGILFLGESVDISLFIGGVLVIFGVILTNLQKKTIKLGS